MCYLLKAGRLDIIYHTFADGTGGLIAFAHSEHRGLPMADYCPPDTKVYAVINDKIAYEVWPKDNEKRYRTEYRRLHSRWPMTAYRQFIAKSESEPDFIFE